MPCIRRRSPCRGARAARSDPASRDSSHGFVSSTSICLTNNRWPCWSAPPCLVFPYQHSAESSSAAVRFGLSANRPVICTPLDIFDDVRPAVEVSEDTSSAALARAISAMVDEDASVSHRQVDRQRDWLMKHSWEHRGQAHADACQVPRCTKRVSRAAASTDVHCIGPPPQWAEK